MVGERVIEASLVKDSRPTVSGSVNRAYVYVYVYVSEYTIYYNICILYILYICTIYLCIDFDNNNSN